MRSSLLPFARPSLDEAEIRAVTEVLRSGWLSTGPRVREFEGVFAKEVGAPAALALSSCTAALHLALCALGVTAGDIVITTPMTFCSSVNVIEHTGGRPVLVDVEADTLNIDPAAVEETIAALQPSDRKRLKAVLAVHLYGHPAELDQLEAICEGYGIALIEDAAHALPSRYRGRTIGSFESATNLRRLAAFSFYAIKNLTTGEGGMLTSDAELIGKARPLSLHGMNADAYLRYGDRGSWYYEVSSPGYKYNMMDIQAAIGVVQLQKLESHQRRRHMIARAYDEAFAELGCIELPVNRNYVEPSRHLYPVRLRLDQLTISRAVFIDQLRDRNIATSVHFIPVHLHPFYASKYGYRPDSFPTAFAAYERLVSLPIYPGMTDQDTSDVIEAVRDVVQRHLR
jgi:dTDP-4-amino-4,6-dideoxygalactose transaminase